MSRLVWTVSICIVATVLWGLVEPRRAHAADGSLTVTVAGSEPFVIDENEGIALDIWREVAQDAGLTFEMLGRSSSVAEGIKKVESGEADVLVGPISITAERSARVRFTQPYYDAQLGIAAPGGGSSKWAEIRPFLSTTFFFFLGILVCVLGIIGTLLWLFERKANPDQFPDGALRGIGSGMWCAIVTATSVGYGDKVPITLGGRIVAAIWMVLAIFGASSLTATIASALTVVQLETETIGDPSQLSGRPVAVVKGTTSATFARAHGARVVEVASVAEALTTAEEGKAVAVVHDKPILRYHLLGRPDSSLVLAPGGYEPQGYGFAVNDPKLQKTLDIALLRIAEKGTIGVIKTRWLGKERPGE